MRSRSGRHSDSSLLQNRGGARMHRKNDATKPRGGIVDGSQQGPQLLGGGVLGAMYRHNPVPAGRKLEVCEYRRAALRRCALNSTASYITSPVSNALACNPSVARLSMAVCVGANSISDKVVSDDAIRSPPASGD